MEFEKNIKEIETKNAIDKAKNGIFAKLNNAITVKNLTKPKLEEILFNSSILSALVFAIIKEKIKHISCNENIAAIA